MTPKRLPRSTQPDGRYHLRTRPLVSLSLALVLVTALLAGCGFAGSAASFTASALVPWLLITSLAAFLVGCGGPRFSGGVPTPEAVTAVPTPTPQPQAKGLKFITQPTKNAGKSEALTPITPAPQVAVVDASGNTVTTFSGTITISLEQNPGNATLAGTTTVNAVNGVATFNDLRISLAAAGYTLKATSGDLTADTSVAFVVSPLSPVFLSARSRTDYGNGTPIVNRFASSAVTTQVTGDFNGDGHLDVAVASYYASPAVVVMLGDGKGHLGAPQVVSTSTDAILSMTAADFNGDGKTDLAIASFKSQQVNVFLSNGDGTFAQGASVTGLLYASGIVSGDFNRDNKTDLAVSLHSNGSGVVQVLLGDGSGGFKATANVSAPTFANADRPLLTVGQFNGDNIDDLAVTYSGFMITLLGNGDGTFSTGTSTQVANTGSLVLPYATHLNGDVNQDLLVNLDNGPFHQLYSLLGDGKGAFVSSPVVPFGAGRDGAAVATDLNGNGKAEIISNVVNVVGAPPSNLALVTLDGGGVQLSAVSSQSFSGYGAPPLLGDFNEDGKTDVVTSTLGLTSVLLGNPADGTTFAEPDGANTVLTNVVASTLADADGDGMPDLLTVSSNGGFAFQKGSGNGQFATQVNSNGQLDATGLAVGDVNGDGKPDVVVSSYKNTQVGVLLNQGGGAFTKSTVAAIYNTIGVVLADVNGDGKLDIVASTDAAHGGVSEVLVLLGKGDGTFNSPGEYGVGNTPTVPQVADLNNDGHPDIAVACKGFNTAVVLLGNGNGTFKAAQTVVSLNDANGIVTGDVNSDGKVDLAVTSPSGVMVVALGNGDGTFKVATNTTLGMPLSNGVAVDFNADGKRDLVIGSSEFSDVAVLIGNGDGTFAAPVYVGTNGVANFVSVTDLNGDGKPDIVSPDVSAGSSTVNLHQ